MIEPRSRLPFEVESPALLLEDCQSSLRAYIISLLANLSEAEDILQETNRYLIQNLDRYTVGTNFKAWSFNVARHRVMSYRRDASRSKTTALTDEVANMLADTAASRLEGEEERIIALRTCVGELPQGERGMLHRVYVEGHRITDIAAETGKQAGALHKTISRIRQALRVCIERKTSGTQP